MDARTTVTLKGFGARLRQLRSAAGISQDELARLEDVTISDGVGRFASSIPDTDRLASLTPE